MKVVILTGTYPHQKALCNKVATVCDVRAIVVSQNIPRKPPSTSQRLQSLVNRAGNSLLGNAFKNTWFQVLKESELLFPEYPKAQIVNVKNVNDDETIKALEQHKPDLVVVSGTNLVGNKIITESNKGRGIVNLHTGISPYVKGGPNCTNWCLATGWFHLIGNTVMWLDAGIDSGNLITTEQTPLNGKENLFELHWKVMQHGDELYSKVLQKLANDLKLPSIPQDSITKGHTFYTRDWNALSVRKAKQNFQNHYPKYFADVAEQERRIQELRLFPLQN